MRDYFYDFADGQPLSSSSRCRNSGRINDEQNAARGELSEAQSYDRHDSDRRSSVDYT